MLTNIERKLTRCAGCRQCLLTTKGKGEVLFCCFRTSGFDGFIPCGTAYHTSCISVGAPFRSRRNNEDGLCYPPIRTWPSFICEACTVRSVTGREVTSSDIHLLVLERIRMIDIAWTWARGTHRAYQTQFNKIRKFENEFDVPVLVPHRPKRPPSSRDIPLMWCIEANTVRSVRHVSRGNSLGPISFGAVRQVRSAASQYYQWDAAITNPSSYLTRDGRLLYQQCRPTDNLSMTMFARGLAKRLGTDVTPSKALLERHVRALDQELEDLFAAPYSTSMRHSLALGGFANITLWLAWLRSSETFGLRYEDIIVTSPTQCLSRDLPSGTGMLEYILLPETKSASTFRADVIVSAVTASGLQPLRWFRRVQSLAPRRRNSDLIFVDDDGSSWTSLSFRRQFLYPCLERLKTQGDPYLQEAPLPSLFWSLHCYRRGARTHVDRAVWNRGTSGLRKSVDAMIFEHGRWRKQQNSLPIGAVYREWTPRDRIKLTQLFF